MTNHKWKVNDAAMCSLLHTYQIKRVIAVTKDNMPIVKSSLGGRRVYAEKSAIYIGRFKRFFFFWWKFVPNDLEEKPVIRRMKA